MKSLDLSRVKIVGFIPNFNPKNGYPEFANIATEAVSASSKSKFDFSNPVAKQVVSKPQAKHIKNAKRAWKKAEGHLKAIKTAILDCKLETGSGVVWRTN